MHTRVVLLQSSRRLSIAIRNKSSIVMSTLSHEILKEQNASTSNAIIEQYKENPLFTKLATFEGNSTLARDKEDDVKLAKGIRFAQQKGVLDPKHKPEPYITIDVLGKTPDQVAGQIMESVESSSSKKKKGSVIVLCGLSGTGKVRNRQYYVNILHVSMQCTHITSMLYHLRERLYPSCVNRWKEQVTRL